MTLRALADSAAARLRARSGDGPARDGRAAPDGHAPRDQPGPAGPTGSSARSRWRAWAGRPGFWPALTGLGLGLLALGPGLGPGFLLSYDMVFVPRMPFSAGLVGLTGGPPRAVPSDAVVAVASLAVPAAILQKAILLLIFVLACSGAAALLASGWAATTVKGADEAGKGRWVGGGAPLPARLAAGVGYAWNPFVAERLLIGQWALLLGYAGLPWVIRLLAAGRERISLPRLLGVMVPAAIGGFAAMSVTALAAVPVALVSSAPGWRLRRLAAVLGGLAVLSLPWLAPALAVGVHTGPRGADAFVARADTPFGRLGSLVMLSGIWNAQTVPRGYGGGASLVWLLLVAAALGGYLLLARPRRLCPGLGAAGLAGLVIAAAGVTPAGRAVLRDLVAAWPGFAVLRDGQQYLAPLALTEAVGLGALTAWLVRAGRAAAPRAGAALGVMAVVAPVVLLPGLAWGLAGRLRPAEYPADWTRARQVIDGDPHPGTALLLPWAVYRRYPWNHGEAVFDPWPRFTAREVISSDALQVGRLVLAPESADSVRLNRIVTAPGPLTGALRAAGVRYVIVDAGPVLRRAAAGRPAAGHPEAGHPAASPAALAALARLPGAQMIIAGPDLVLFRLPPPTASGNGG
ncbi:MAG TPA: hypothetical protein VGG50_11995 [Streptosporangiaceae bacterium]